jgi:aminodeoxyfutalosine synthase
MDAIEEKIHAGERLSFDDGVALFHSSDLLRIGRLANKKRRERWQDRAYFVVNRHLNPTNVCFSGCRFCAFAKVVGEKGAWTFTPEEAVERATQTMEDWSDEVTELHIVSGLHPDLPFEYYEGLLVALRARFPKIHLKAYTAVELNWFSEISGLDVKEVLERLRTAGLDSLPGGGAEIFADRVRDELCANKIYGDRWLEIHETAHEMGLTSTATMLYGHVETLEERVDHMVRLRESQDISGGYSAFIPLSFHPKDTPMDDLPGPSGYDALRTLAISRLMLDNIPHIKVYWVMSGLDVAQIALHYGADDVDGTVIDETITWAAGKDTRRGITQGDLVRLIKETGFRPIQRDTLYKELRSF